jgi:hypothetical protein
MKQLKQCKGYTQYGRKCRCYVSIGDYCFKHHPTIIKKTMLKSNRIKLKPSNPDKYQYLRRYLYPETVNEVINFINTNEIKTPNNRDNFAFSIQQYINSLKYKAKALDIKDIH